MGVINYKFLSFLQVDGGYTLSQILHGAGRFTYKTGSFMVTL